MKTDVISIIIPTYNVGRYIDRCLKSLEAQTYGMDNLEIILIDDASTDNTLLHLEAFESKYPDNVILVKSSENHGPAMSRNTGLRLASGKYITFIDSDDFINDTMLYKMAMKIKEYDCDVVECGFLQFTNDTDIVVFNDIPESVYLNSNENMLRFLSFYDYNRCAVWGRLYKASFIFNNNLWFYDELWYDDVAFSGLCMFLIGSFYRINETLYYYYDNTCGITNETYYPERSRHEPEATDVLLNELYERNMLKDIMQDHRREILYAYITSKAFLDPFHKLINSNLDLEHTLNEFDYYKKYLLDLFPDNPAHWQLNNLNEISRLAYHLLVSDNATIEQLFKDHVSSNIVIIYAFTNPDFSLTHSRINDIMGENRSEIPIIDITNEIYYSEHLLLMHAIKEDDIVVISVDKYLDKHFCLLAFDLIQLILNEYPNRKITILLQNLYLEQTDEFVRRLAEFTHYLEFHSHLTLYLFDNSSYELAHSIMPSVKILIPTI